MTAQRLVILLAIFLAIGIATRFYLQRQAEGVPRGTGVIYAIDANGDAAVEISERTYFSRADVEANFDTWLQRLGDKPLDTDTLRKSMVERAEAMSKTLGRAMSVDSFAARPVRTPEYGGRSSTFMWHGFAGREEAHWRIEFPDTQRMFMNSYSFVTIVLPTGSELLNVTPPATEQTGLSLTWRGPLETDWPVVLYRHP